MAPEFTSRESRRWAGASGSRYPVICRADFVGYRRIMLQSAEEDFGGEKVTACGTGPPERAPRQTSDAAPRDAIARDKTPLSGRALLAVPLAAAVTLCVHLLVWKNELPSESS